MASELDIFVGNTTLIDEDVYRLWLDGYSVNDAVALRVRSGILEQTGATAAVLQSDTMDHYRTFHMLERLLHAPPKLLHQLIFQIPPSRQALLIERYYAFDEAFVREVLGKKLSKGTKKDLDDISAKTGITLKSCRRQFDNFKRVFKVVEEMRGSLSDNIQQHFLLSDRLARDYAAIVFFANNRFETGKKKLQYLSFGDFAYCAELMIQNWTLGAGDSQADDMDMDLDKEFLQDLKELKVLVADKDLLDLHKSLVCTALRGKLGVFSEMEANFKDSQAPCPTEPVPGAGERGRQADPQQGCQGPVCRSGGEVRGTLPLGPLAAGRCAALPQSVYGICALPGRLPAPGTLGPLHEHAAGLPPAPLPRLSPPPSPLPTPTIKLPRVY
ncbi:acidic fibroblast growth factor intracellular-binding protein isoform X1 [Ochotona curzoniae]|uniref:acidic fibroblast growth factor intracellular-binding protein isoform X1 n=1 Tax=Ochotona curzoniae TaxID=130825 RepID=UPI001B349C0E|nr:acidic fibroblast growth factor intracellular-binding protein isoform X1 [Ochotona curzoniae]